MDLLLLLQALNAALTLAGAGAAGVNWVVISASSSLRNASIFNGRDKNGGAALGS